jgi:molybdopterin/thiamine biosynthesis adenylyltransferase
MDNRRVRFSDADWYDETGQEITIIGAGGTGSWTSVLLARTGNHDMYIYDMDTVDEVNMAGQMYETNDIGVNKASVIKSKIKTFTGNRSVTIFERYTEDCFATNIMFCCPDNMAVRKLSFNKWKGVLDSYCVDHQCDYIQADTDFLFVDLRLSAESLQVFFVTPSKISQYEEWLFDDSELPEAACSYKQTSHFAAMIAGKAVQGFCNWLATSKGHYASVPFMYEERGQLFLTNIVD